MTKVHRDKSISDIEKIFDKFRKNKDKEKQCIDSYTINTKGNVNKFQIHARKGHLRSSKYQRFFEILKVYRELIPKVYRDSEGLSRI